MSSLRCSSYLGEAQVEDVGVEFGQGSGEAVPVQVLPTELAAEQRGGVRGALAAGGGGGWGGGGAHLLQSFLGRLTSRMCDRMVVSWVV